MPRNIKGIIESYGIIPPGYLKVRFKDETELFLVPDEQSDISSVLLYQKEGLKAIAILDRSKQIFYGGIEQAKMAEYWEYVTTLGTIIKIARENNNINDELWNKMGFKRIWEISQKGWQARHKLYGNMLHRTDKIPENLAEIIIKISETFQ